MQWKPKCKYQENGIKPTFVEREFLDGNIIQKVYTCADYRGILTETFEQPCVGSLPWKVTTATDYLLPHFLRSHEIQGESYLPDGIIGQTQQLNCQQYYIMQNHTNKEQQIIQFEFLVQGVGISAAFLCVCGICVFTGVKKSLQNLFYVFSF